MAYGKTKTRMRRTKDNDKNPNEKDEGPVMRPKNPPKK